MEETPGQIFSTFFLYFFPIFSQSPDLNNSFFFSTIVRAREQILGMWRIAFKHYTILCICSFFSVPRPHDRSIFPFFFVVKAIQTFSLDQIGRVFLCCPLKKCIIVFVNFNSPFDLLTSAGVSLSIAKQKLRKIHGRHCSRDGFFFGFYRRSQEVKYFLTVLM